MVVVPDRDGEGEDPLGSSGADTDDGASAVSFAVAVEVSLQVQLMDSATWRSGLKTGCREWVSRACGQGAAAR